MAQTGCQIDVDDEGNVSIASNDAESCKLAVEIVRGLTEEPEAGKTYKGRVKRIVDFGAFVEIIPGIEGLLHISEVAYERVETMDQYMREGDIIEVKLLEVERNGKMRLSRKALLPPPAGYVPRPESERSPDRGGDRGGSRDRGGPRGGGRR